MRMQNVCNQFIDKVGHDGCVKKVYKNVYAVAFHDLLWYFTILCLMSKENYLETAISIESIRFYTSTRSCCPGNFSSSSFLQLRSMVSIFKAYSLWVYSRIRRCVLQNENLSSSLMCHAWDWLWDDD